MIVPDELAELRLLPRDLVRVHVEVVHRSRRRVRREPRVLARRRPDGGPQPLPSREAAPKRLRGARPRPHASCLVSGGTRARAA